MQSTHGPHDEDVRVIQRVPTQALADPLRPVRSHSGASGGWIESPRVGRGGAGRGAAEPKEQDHSASIPSKATCYQ